MLASAWNDTTRFQRRSHAIGLWRFVGAFLEDFEWPFWYQRRRRFCRRAENVASKCDVFYERTRSPSLSSLSRNTRWRWCHRCVGATRAGSSFCYSARVQPQVFFHPRTGLRNPSLLLREIRIPRRTKLPCSHFSFLEIKKKHFHSSSSFLYIFRLTSR